MSELANPMSRIERVKYGSRETATHLADVDDLIVYPSNEGGAVVEFIRYGANGKPLEGYRLTLCPEDISRIKHVPAT